MAGLDFGRGRTRVGVELQYTLVPSAIGQDGVSKVYGESDVGGVSLVAKVTFGGGR